MCRRIVLVAGMLGLLLVGASGADAAAMFTDPTGDATGGATDITGVAVSNDATGNITISLTTNRTVFTSDDIVAIVLNTDKDASTGVGGFDYGIGVGALGAVLLKANGTTFTRVTSQTTLQATNNNMTVTINRSDLGGTTGFTFAVRTSLVSNQAAMDSAPDTGTYAYDLGLKPVLNTLAARFSPAKPKAGHVFRLAATQLRLEGGTIVKADSITCVATLNGKRLAGRCAWHIPANARGKRLVVVLTAHYQGATATFTPWRFRVG
jgi:hypothetical protein